jgi:hypothetical protein
MKLITYLNLLPKLRVGEIPKIPAFGIWHHVDWNFSSYVAWIYMYFYQSSQNFHMNSAEFFLKYMFVLPTEFPPLYI